jgi:Mrp family chromosome partitioning ATPase/capsular polysaccharide biosynthesis protein
MSSLERSAADDSALQEYLRIILRRKWLVLALIVVAGATAYLVAKSRPAVYQGKAQIILTRQDSLAAVTGQQSPNDAASADRLIQTLADLARLPSVAQRTLAAAGVRKLSPRGLLEASSVNPSTQSDVITFAVEDRDRALASRLATAYAQQFRAYRNELDSASIAEAQASVERELKRLGNAGTQTAAYAYLLGKAEQLQSLEALQSANSYVVQPAEQAVQVRPRPFREGALAAVVGLLLGVALAFASETLDTRVRSVDEIRDTLGLRILARIPTPPRRRGRGVSAGRFSPQAEAFRTLRINLDLVNVQQHAKTIMVAGAHHEEGKSTTIANLAIALGRAGRSVAIVDCDVHGPSLHRLFGVEAAPGLTDVLLNDVPLDGALRTVPLGRASAQRANGSAAGVGVVRVLPGGRSGVDDTLVAGDAIGQLLRELASEYDFVLVDTPPLLEFGDGIDLSAHVDGVVVVVRLKSTKRAALAELERVLAELPAEPLGVVVTAAEGTVGGYYAQGSYGDGARERSLGRVPAP